MRLESFSIDAPAIEFTNSTFDKILSVPGSTGPQGIQGPQGDPGRGYTSVDVSGDDLLFTATSGPVESVPVPALAAASASASAAAASATAADNSRVLAEQAAEDAQNGIVPDGSVTVSKFGPDVVPAVSDIADARAENRIGFYRGAADGLAPLDGNGVISPVYLPSYVDDVEEAADLASLPATGEPDKIYIALDTGRIYRWSGSAYAEISPSPGSTDAVPEGAANLYYTNTRVTSQVQTLFGSSAGTVTQGNDVRLSDARTPTVHSHAQSDITGLDTTLAGKVGSPDVFNILVVTQSAYDALGPGRPATTFYVIAG